MEPKSEDSLVSSFAALKYVVLGIACTIALGCLQGILILAFGRGEGRVNNAHGLVLLILLPQPIAQAFIGLWIGSRAARFAWLLAPIPSVVLASLTVVNSGFVRGWGLEQLWPVYLLFGVPSLLGGLVGHFLRLLRHRKAVVSSAK